MTRPKLKDIDRSVTAPFGQRYVTQFSSAKHTPLQPAERRPDWVPPEWKPARPGADDHKQFKSLGV
jgi:hypothetical protein